MPGPKERPALVLEVEESLEVTRGYVVTVAYATSQKLAKVYPGEFVVSARQRCTGLHSDTKFDIARYHRLPFTDVWFCAVRGSNPPHPRIGRLDLENPVTRKNLQQAIRAALAQRRQ